MERGWKPNIEISPPCPRCGSSNTKFCYYNNYSLTQPRYFCKGCRRYWTKGGSLRNVPIGGGCRKSRRGKSIRVSTDHGGVNSRNSAHNRVESSSSINSAEASTSNIDLAAVYATFLNQAPRPDQNQIESVSELAPDRIVNVIPTTFEFSSFQFSPHLPQENVFYECGQFPARLSETPLFGPANGNSTFFGGIDAFQKQQFTAGNSLMSINHMENDHMMLPPLPGEEVVMSEGMVWPNSDVILPNQILPSNQEIIRSEVRLPTEENSEVLINGNESTFSGLNLEAIFRS